MDLFCPHCSKRVSIPDDKAGQVMSCPLCAKQFMAPSLAPPPAPVSAPPPPPPPPVTSVAAGEPKIEPTASSEPAAPPPPPGDYTGSLAFYLRAEWLVFIPPVCLFLIFVSSFFTWHNEGGGLTLGLWGLAFTQDGKAQFLAYVILMLFPTGPLLVASVILDKVFTPPQLLPYTKWKNLLVGMLLLFTFLPLVLDYFLGHFVSSFNAIATAEKIAIRLHFIAMLASFGMFWLHHRKANNLPAPKLEARW